VLTLADRHGAAELREACVRFVVNRFSEVHATDGFKDLARPLLEDVHAAIAARMAAAARPVGPSPARSAAPSPDKLRAAERLSITGTGGTERE